MNATRTYHRFDAITVRAATRLLHRARTGQVSAWEVDPYLQHLADMDTSAQPAEYRALRRIARRRAACGTLAPAVPSTLRRTQASIRGVLAVQEGRAPGPVPRPIERLWE